MTTPRRTFLKKAGMLGLLSQLPLPGLAANRHPDNPTQPYVQFARDGLDFSPQEYACQLEEIADSRGIAPDSYSNGGIVAELEEQIAALLGKEAAVYMPTGTLANHLAVRRLARPATRVLVPAESHLYNDSGDCAQVLSGLNLVPLRPGAATFTLEDVQEQAARAGSGRVHTGIGAIVIESPVRRMHNTRFDFSEMQRISAWARGRGIGLHLDGARLFNLPAHSGVGVKEYAALFDTVYVSLYKNFNAASGAILAGSRAFCAGLYHTRRMFGGSQPQAWVFAAVALKYLHSFEQDYRQALQRVEAVFRELDGYRLTPLPGGTNIMRLELTAGHPAAVRQKLLAARIRLNAPAAGFSGFYLKINPSVLRREVPELREVFSRAIG